ncbi:MAG: chromate transporter [Burkholderiales bacterium]|nr:chromate transporter [Burkholderiales bacterium]
MNMIILSKYFNLFITFTKISLFAFGGGNGMLEVLRYNTVDLRNWVTIEEFNLITGVSIALPGLNALNIACIIGYKVAGLMGAIISMFAISIPSLVIVVAFYEIMLKFLSPQAIKYFETIMQYAVIVLVANIIYNNTTSLIAHNHVSVALTILSIILFIAIAIFKLDTIVCLCTFIAIASLVIRW